MPFLQGPLFRTCCALATLAVFAVILYQSTQPRGQAGVLDLTANEALLAHSAVYAVLSFCAMGLLTRRTFAAVAGLFTLAIVLGVAMELVQMSVPSRNASVDDVFADAAGAVAGIGTYLLIVWFLEPPPARQPTKR